MDDLGVGALLRADEAGGYLLSEMQARERADAYRADAEKLEAQVATLRAENEGLRAQNQTLQRELDQSMALYVACKAQAKVLYRAAKELDHPVTRGAPAAHELKFQEVYDQEASARGLPVGNWSK